MNHHGRILLAAMIGLCVAGVQSACANAPYVAVRQDAYQFASAVDRRLYAALPTPVTADQIISSRQDITGSHTKDVADSRDARFPDIDGFAASLPAPLLIPVPLSFPAHGGWDAFDYGGTMVSPIPVQVAAADGSPPTGLPEPGSFAMLAGAFAVFAAAIGGWRRSARMNAAVPSSFRSL